MKKEKITKMYDIKNDKGEVIGHGCQGTSMNWNDPSGTAVPFDWNNLNPSGTGNAFYNPWLPPELIDFYEYKESIEFVYIERSSVTYLTVYPIQNLPPQERVFKIVFSCKNGKWHKSEPIYGQIIPASEESYIFPE